MQRRLLLAQALVLLTSGATTWLVALLVGPALFREHLHQAGVPRDSSEQYHAEQAYQHATAISIAVAIAVAALTAFVVTAYLSRRVQRSVAEVSAAASAVAEGSYDIRVSSPQLGGEFDELASAFNQMAERLQAVESTRRQLFGDLAHEIRTPVSVLEAYLEAVEDGVKTLDLQTITTLRDQTARLVRFSADAAALAQAEEAQATIAPEWLDAGELLGAVRDAAADRYTAKGVEITAREDGPIFLWADRQRLTQVLGNLVDNALRHTPSGGHVTLAAVQQGLDTVFTVTDDGEGVAAEHLPHLFERFYRADPARHRGRGGAGIGLAIARALTEAHGGRISAGSQGPGTGTTLTVTIPSRPPAASRGTRPREVDDRAASPGL
ncbi:HAMP domain-containing histidine kinase [Mycobacterium sp. SMC-8]|nr:HAMP domain-containing histidine kinase [Mycobacterium sp. SMC-8]